jgi:hypothetical protein
MFKHKFYATVILLLLHSTQRGLIKAVFFFENLIQYITWDSVALVSVPRSAHPACRYYQQLETEKYEAG